MSTKIPPFFEGRGGEGLPLLWCSPTPSCKDWTSKECKYCSVDWNFTVSFYCVVGRVSSTCVNVPCDIVTVNLSLRTPMSARGLGSSCQTGGPQRVALAHGQNIRHVRFLATGRLHPDWTSHVTSWVHAMSTATSQSMSSNSHCRIHFSLLVSWINLT